MADNWPNDAALLEAVIEFLRDDLRLQLTENRLRYNTLIAVNLLGIVKRGIEQQAENHREEKDLLQALLDSPGECDQLNRLLCKEIDEGRWSTKDASLQQTLLKIAVKKVAIDNPLYSTYQQLTQGKTP